MSFRSLPVLCLGLLVGTGCWVDWSRPDAGGAPSDAMAVDGSVGDAGGAVPACAPTGVGPFGTPVRIVNTSSGNTEDAPSLTSDGLSLFLRSNRGAPGLIGTGAIFVSRRSRTDLDWGPPEFVSELDGMGRNREPEISGDGRTIYWASERREGSLEIWVAHRDDPAGTWGTPDVAPGMLGVIATAPTVTEDGRLMVIESEDLTPSLGGDELYSLTRDDPSAGWSAPQWMEVVNSDQSERSPFISDDGLVLYFERQESSGITNIYRASRLRRDDPFGVPEEATELNSTGSESSPFLTADCSRVYLSSDRDGSPDLFVAE